MFWFGRVVGMVRADQKARWPQDFFCGKKEKEEVGKKKEMKKKGIDYYCALGIELLQNFHRLSCFSEKTISNSPNRTASARSQSCFQLAFLSPSISS